MFVCACLAFYTEHIHVRIDHVIFSFQNTWKISLCYEEKDYGNLVEELFQILHRSVVFNWFYILLILLHSIEEVSETWQYYFHAPYTKAFSRDYIEIHQTRKCLLPKLKYNPAGGCGIE